MVVCKACLSISHVEQVMKPVLVFTQALDRHEEYSQKGIVFFVMVFIVVESYTSFDLYQTLRR